MQQEARHFECELAVIGSGLAGFAASIFALGRGIKTAQIGNTGAVAYTTGYLDLYGRQIDDRPGPVVNPWQGIAALAEQAPDHPLSRVSAEDIRAAFDEFTGFLGSCGIAYGRAGDRNQDVLTPAGTVKPTLCVPATMQAGVEAYARRSRCVIVDFRGLKGFSGRQVVANLGALWPALRTERVTFPDMPHGEIYPEVMARALEVPATRALLAETIKPVLGDAEVVGLPAVLGMHAPDSTHAEMERLLGLPVFEVPTMPPSVPGIRLREMFEQVFPQKGLILVPQQKVRAVDFAPTSILLHQADNYGPITISAGAVILATGRFLSGGLEARMDQVYEPLLDLPVRQPASRDQWYRMQYMDPQGHAVHRAGIEVDNQFRPLDASGAPVDRRLFAAGVVLAGQDWIRERCGAGVAVATAFRAVQAVRALLAQ